MKTIVEISTNLSKFIFDDSVDIQITETSIITPEFVVACHNSSDVVMYEGVTPPEDWIGNKYTFDGITWELVPEIVPVDDIEDELIQ